MRIEHISSEAKDYAFSLALHDAVDRIPLDFIFHPYQSNDRENGDANQYFDRLVLFVTTLKELNLNAQFLKWSKVVEDFWNEWHSFFIADEDVDAIVDIEEIYATWLYQIGKKKEAIDIFHAIDPQGYEEAEQSKENSREQIAELAIRKDDVETAESLIGSVERNLGKDDLCIEYMKMFLRTGEEEKAKQLLFLLKNAALMSSSPELVKIVEAALNEWHDFQLKALSYENLDSYLLKISEIENPQLRVNRIVKLIEHLIDDHRQRDARHIIQSFFVDLQESSEEPEKKHNFDDEAAGNLAFFGYVDRIPTLHRVRLLLTLVKKMSGNATYVKELRQCIYGASGILDLATHILPEMTKRFQYRQLLIYLGGIRANEDLDILYENIRKRIPIPEDMSIEVFCSSFDELGLSLEKIMLMPNTLEKINKLADYLTDQIDHLHDFSRWKEVAEAIKMVEREFLRAVPIRSENPPFESAPFPLDRQWSSDVFIGDETSESDALSFYKTCVLRREILIHQITRKAIVQKRWEIVGTILSDPDLRPEECINILLEL